MLWTGTVPFCSIAFALIILLRAQDTNIAVNKPVYVSSRYNADNDPKLITDGKEDRVFSSKHRDGREEYAVIDLGDVYQIQKVKIIGRGKYFTNFKIITGLQFNGGNPYPSLQTYTTCNEVGTDKNYVKELECKGTGRYIGIQKMDENILQLVEFKVYGSKGTGGNTVEPSVPNEDNSKGSQEQNTQETDEWQDQNVPELTRADVNQAYRKPTFTSKGNNKDLTDGRKTGLYFGGKEKDWYVIDLQKVYKIKAIRLTGHKANFQNRKANLEIRLLRSFNPCGPRDNSEGYQCGRGRLDESKTIGCSQETGQFLAVNFRGNDETIIYEIEVFGELQRKLAPMKAPPTLNVRETFPEWKVTKPDIRNTIISGVDRVEVLAQTGIILPVSQNAQSILQHPRLHRSALVGSTVKSGRVLCGGHSSMLETMKKQSMETKFWKQAAEWLANNNNPHFHFAQEVDETTFSSPGAIVLWDGHQPVSPAKANLIRNKVVAGRAGVFYTLRSFKNDEFYQANIDLMLEAGIYFDLSGYSARNTESWPVKVNDMSTLLTPGYQIHKLLQSTSNFINDGVSSIESINKFPPSVLEPLGVHDVLLKLVERYKPLAQSWTPCKARELASTSVNLRRFIASYGALMTSVGLARPGNGPDKNEALKAAPNVALFPGAVRAGAVRVTTELKIIGTAEREIHPTGLYLPPGGTLDIEVLSLDEESNLDDWLVYVGCHTGNLARLNTWHRFPMVYNTITLRNRKIYNGFGGIIGVRNSKKDAGAIRLRLRGGVQAPFFNLRDPKNMADWNNRGRHSPGPFAEISGDMMTFCLPSVEIRSFTKETLEDVMENYIDKIVKEGNHLRGTDWKTRRRQRLVLDVQIYGGAAVSGYPIMGTFNWVQSLLYAEWFNTKGSQLLFHEVGHNLQRPAWTPDGTGEVTNMIFALFNFDRLNLPYFENFQKFDSNNGKNRLNGYFAASAPYSKWLSDSAIALTLYAQIGHHLGWTCYNKVFRKYITDDINPEKEEKMDIWIITISNTCNYNFIPFFDLWGIPISQRVKNGVNRNLKYFFPDDFVMQLEKARPRINQIKRKYGISSPTTPPNREKADAPFMNEMKTFTERLPNDVEVTIKG